MAPRDGDAFEAKSLHGRQVIAIREGRLAGRVANLVFDPAEHRLLGLLVSRSRRGAALFLPVGSVRRLGPLAVTIDFERNLEPIAAHPDAAGLAGSGTRFIGTPVILEDGCRIATLRGIWLNSACDVVRYDAVQGVFPFEQRIQIAPEHVIIVGPDAMVLRADPRPRLAEAAE